MPHFRPTACCFHNNTWNESEQTTRCSSTNSLKSKCYTPPCCLHCASAFNPPWICHTGNLVMLLATLRWDHPGWKTRERKKRKMEVEEEEEEEEEGGGRRRTTHRLSQGSLGQCQLWWQRPLVRHHHCKLKHGKKHRYHTWTAVKLMMIQCSRLYMQMKGWSMQLQWHSLNLWHDNKVFILKTHHNPLWCIKPSRSIH